MLSCSFTLLLAVAIAVLTLNVKGYVLFKNDDRINAGLVWRLRREIFEKDFDANFKNEKVALNTRSHRLKG